MLWLVEGFIAAAIIFINWINCNFYIFLNSICDFFGQYFQWTVSGPSGRRGAAARPSAATSTAEDTARDRRTADANAKDRRARVDGAGPVALSATVISTATSDRRRRKTIAEWHRKKMPTRWTGFLNRERRKRGTRDQEQDTRAETATTSIITLKPVLVDHSIMQCKNHGVTSHYNQLQKWWWSSFLILFNATGVW